MALKCKKRVSATLVPHRRTYLDLSSLKMGPDQRGIRIGMWEVLHDQCLQQKDNRNSNPEKSCNESIFLAYKHWFKDAIKVTCFTALPVLPDFKMSFFWMWIRVSNLWRLTAFQRGTGSRWQLNKNPSKPIGNSPVHHGYSRVHP